MRVMVLVKATAWSEAGLPPSEEMAPMFEAMGRFNEELVAAGVMEAGEGLKPSSAGKRVVLGGAKPEVVNGPFPLPDELVAGFWLWTVKDMDEAVAWARRCPHTMPGGGVLELRPIYELEDFGDAVPPEVAASEARMREQLAAG